MIHLNGDCWFMAQTPRHTPCHPCPARYALVTLLTRCPTRCTVWVGTLQNGNTAARREYRSCFQSTLTFTKQKNRAGIYVQPPVCSRYTRYLIDLVTRQLSLETRFEKSWSCTHVSIPISIEGHESSLFLTAHDKFNDFLEFLKREAAPSGLMDCSGRWPSERSHVGRCGWLCEWSKVGCCENRAGPGLEPPTSAPGRCPRCIPLNKTTQ